MRLQQKTNRSYFLFSSLLFLLAGVFLFFVLTSIIDEEVNEQLFNTEKRVVKQLQSGRIPTEIPPVLEVRLLLSPQQEQITVRDTAMYDNVEGEEETFREVSSVRNMEDRSYSIVVRQMIITHSSYLMTIGGILALVMGFLLLCLAIVNKTIFKKVWKPFYSTLDALKSFSVQQPGGLDLQKSNILEFREMNTVLVKLTDKASSDYRALREFTENASHEIQTPLAVIQNKLDELLQDPSLQEQQAKHLQIAGSAVQKLSKLNQTLLLLTKIENRQFIFTEKVNLISCILRQMELQEDFIDVKKLQVSLEVPSEYYVSAHPSLVDVLLTNLVGNAIKHNIPHGIVSIEMIHGSLRIANTGKELSVAPSLLFERFSKADASSSSLGLGLAIVQTICVLYGWQVKYEVNDGQHLLEVIFQELGTT
jgi:signal transduction histidine kinase